MKFFKNAKLFMVAQCLGVVFIGGCGHYASLRLYPDDVPPGSLRLAQVMVVGTRDDIVLEKAWHNALLQSAIPDNDIQDGSIAVGRIYCCGGTAEVPTRQAFYVPKGMQVQPFDIVEIRAGLEPSGHGGGQVNVMTRVVQPVNSNENTCRWVPPNPRLWMRILYCNWMEKEGWMEKKESLDHTWFKPLGNAGLAK